MNKRLIASVLFAVASSQAATAATIFEDTFDAGTSPWYAAGSETFSNDAGRLATNGNDVMGRSLRQLP